MMMLSIFPLFFFVLAENPPEDFIGLLDAQEVLEEMNVETSEEALIELLSVDEKVETVQKEPPIDEIILLLSEGNFKERQKAKVQLEEVGEPALDALEKLGKSDDPELKLNAREIAQRIRSKRKGSASDQGDTEYLKKVMALCLLQSSKSTAAIPVIKKIASSGDITLSYLAKRALGVIGDKKLSEGASHQLHLLQGKAPSSTSATFLLDFQRKRKSLTLENLVQGVKKQLMESGGQMAQLAGTIENMMVPQLKKSIVEVTKNVGYFRIDGVALFLSKEFPLSPQTMTMTYVVKGLHDPQRFSNYFATQKNLEEVVINGKKCLKDGHSLICSLDPSTLVFIIGQGDASLQAVLTDLGSDKGITQVPSFTTALAELKGKRLSTGGTFTQENVAAMQAEFTGELQRIENRKNPRDTDALQKQFCMTMLLISKVGAISGYIDDRFGITIKGAVATVKQGQEFVDAITALDVQIRTVLKEVLNKADVQKNPGMLNISPELLSEPLFNAKSSPGEVQLTNEQSDLLQLLMLFFGVQLGPPPSND